jgi:hypothetical protein
MPDIPAPHPIQVAKEVSEILAEYGSVETPQDLEHLANGADRNPNAYDGWPETGSPGGRRTSATRSRNARSPHREADLARAF